MRSAMTALALLMGHGTGKWLQHARCARICLFTGSSMGMAGLRRGI
jgi:hypothetical protein